MVYIPSLYAFYINLHIIYHYKHTYHYNIIILYEYLAYSCKQCEFKCAVDFRKPFFLVKNSEKNPKTSGARGKRGCDRPFAVGVGGLVYCSWLRIVAPVFEWGPEGVVVEAVVIYNSSVGF